MKRLVKICAVVLILGLVLAIGGWAAGGKLYTSYWHGSLHTVRESLDKGNAFIPPWQSRGWKYAHDPDDHAVAAPDSMTDTVSDLNFELACGSFTLIDGEDFSVTGPGADRVRFWMDEDTWHIEAVDPSLKNMAVTIEMPLTRRYDEISIEAETAELHADSLSCREFDLELGAGAATIARLDADDTDISCGMGRTDVTLAGTPDDYTIDGECAMGALNLNGKPLLSGIAGSAVSGSGPRQVDAEVGAGAIDLHFES